MHNAINWFEIPVADLARATRFYEQVMDCRLKPEAMGDSMLALFPAEDPGVGGCLISHPTMRPSSEGACVYLNAGRDLAPVLARVQSAGGCVVVPRTKISDEIGWFAVFADSEGNRVGLHSTH